MVFGVSVEDTFVHRDFVSTNKLPILMLADTERSVHRVVGVKPGTVISYLIGTDRRILHVFKKPSGPGHAQEVLTVLAQLSATGSAAATNHATAAPAPTAGR